MFLRPSSMSFCNGFKSNAFRSEFQNSLQFGSHRASLANANFSYMIEFSQSYTFANNIIIENGWRGPNYNYDNVVAYTCQQYGIKSLEFKYDGSGDSGDFEFESCESSANFDLSSLKAVGMIDAVAYTQDHHMRRRVWRPNPNAPIANPIYSFYACIENAMYRQLNNQFGGWEINSGSFGKVSWEQFFESITIDHNDHFYECEVCEEMYNDDEGCSCIICDECGEKSLDGKCEYCAEENKAI